MAPSEHTMTFAIVALAAAMVSTAATAQAGPDAAANRQRQLVDIVEREQARNGVYSVELIAPLSELAFLHQEAGDRAVASATVERVLQVIRANYGLYSLAQAPLILQLIANENAAGNNDTAWELEEELVSLAKRHPADLRTVPIFREVVRERMSLGSQELPLELVCRSHGSTEGCNARGVIVADALNNVGAAINVFLNNRLYGSPELRELEQKLIDWGSCDVARDSYRRLMFYDGETRESWLNRAATMVRAADAELICSVPGQPDRKRAALNGYRKAYELLERNAVAQASIDELFTPPAPISLSARAYPMLFAATLDSSSGHIDIAFEITEYGRARKVEIIDATANTTDEKKKRVFSLVRDGLYRPRAANGEILDRAPVVWRYYW
jgi:hypothetical protein